MYELQFRWQAIPSGIRILQGYGDLTSIPVPSRIQGMPVTEIGPYCFSATEPRSKTSLQSDIKDNISGFRLGSPRTLEEEKILEDPALPPLKGRQLEAIFLPASIQLLHNAAFYNCRGLQTLGIGQEVTAIGSDVFTNCTSLQRLFYEGDEKEAFALSLILGRLEMNLEVIFQNRQEVTGALFFPEYYEWLDEVTPAHLFSRSIHGEGFRMRKCFQDRQLRYDKYDTCFDNAIKTESGQTLCRIALLRLLWPVSLSPHARTLYKDTLKIHFDTALKLILSERKNRRNPLAQLRLLMDIAGSPEASSAALSACIAADWSEGAAFIMENRRHQSFARKEYSFDDPEDF